MKYSVVIPVFNGELTIKPLFKRIKDFFENLNLDYEVIFVYDCGKDNSWESLKSLKTGFPQDEITLLKLTRNYGQHNALICGFEYAEGDFIITMDEDLQHTPEDIIKLINKQKEGDFDVVYGRYNQKQHSKFRNITSNIVKYIIHKGIPDVHPDYSAFRLIRKSIAKACLEMQNSYTFLDGYISWITTNCSSCIVSHNERLAGVSAYNFNNLLNHAINIFVTFSNYPIRLLTKLSFGVILITICFSIYVVLRKLIFNDLAMGYPSIVIAVGFSVGAIMFALGIIGEYIYRINLKTTKRPNYKVAEKINN